MNERYLKTIAHLLLAGLALYEYTESEGRFRKMLCAGAAGWHIGAAHCDWQNKNDV